MDKKKRKGWFRKVSIHRRIYHMPITERLARMLSRNEVFYGTFEQALTAERLRIRQ